MSARKTKVSVWSCCKKQLWENLKTLPKALKFLSCRESTRRQISPVIKKILWLLWVFALFGFVEKLQKLEFWVNFRIEVPMFERGKKNDSAKRPTILDRIKRNNRPSPPHPPKGNDDGAKVQNAPFCYHWDGGEGGGGLDFPFILSKIVGMSLGPQCHPIHVAPSCYVSFRNYPTPTPTP